MHGPGCRVVQPRVVDIRLLKLAKTTSQCDVVLAGRPVCACDPHSKSGSCASTHAATAGTDWHAHLLWPLLIGTDYAEALSGLHKHHTCPASCHCQLLSRHSKRCAVTARSLATSRSDALCTSAEGASPCTLSESAAASTTHRGPGSVEAGGTGVNALRSTVERTQGALQHAQPRRSADPSLHQICVCQSSKRPTRPRFLDIAEASLAANSHVQLQCLSTRVHAFAPGARDCRQ